MGKRTRCFESVTVKSINHLQSLCRFVSRIFYWSHACFYHCRFKLSLPAPIINSVLCSWLKWTTENILWLADDLQLKHASCLNFISFANAQTKWHCRQITPKNKIYNWSSKGRYTQMIVFFQPMDNWWWTNCELFQCFYWSREYDHAKCRWVVFDHSLRPFPNKLSNYFRCPLAYLFFF